MCCVNVLCQFCCANLLCEFVVCVNVLCGFVVCFRRPGSRLKNLANIVFWTVSRLFQANQTHTGNSQL